MAKRRPLEEIKNSETVIFNGRMYGYAFKWLHTQDLPPRQFLETLARGEYTVVKASLDEKTVRELEEKYKSL